MHRVSRIVQSVGIDSSELSLVADKVALYRINSPIQLLASDYGVPQNRVRVVFIGCRNDQDMITSIPATVSDGEKVTVAEAIGDLNYITLSFLRNRRRKSMLRSGTYSYFLRRDSGDNVADYLNHFSAGKSRTLGFQCAEMDSAVDVAV